MKNSYSVQALAVNTVNTVNQDSDLGEALREAEVTLNALAVIGDNKVLLSQELIPLCEKFLLLEDWGNGHVGQFRSDLRRILKK
jgi:hypothetical protein